MCPATLSLASAPDGQSRRDDPAHAERAIELNESFPAGWIFRTALLARAERMDEARECLARLRERAPGITLAGVDTVMRSVFRADSKLLDEFVSMLQRGGLD